MKIFGSFLVISSARHPVYNEHDVGMSENSDGIMLDDDRKKVERSYFKWLNTNILSLISNTKKC